MTRTAFLRAHPVRLLAGPQAVQLPQRTLVLERCVAKNVRASMLIPHCGIGVKKA